MSEKNIGTCDKCALTWPDCGAATNCYVNCGCGYGYSPQMVAGCASHFQPRAATSGDPCPHCLLRDSECKDGATHGCGWEYNYGKFQPRNTVAVSPCLNCTSGPSNTECEWGEGFDEVLTCAHWTPRPAADTDPNEMATPVVSVKTSTEGTARARARPGRAGGEGGSV